MLQHSIVYVYSINNVFTNRDFSLQYIYIDLFSPPRSPPKKNLYTLILEFIFFIKFEERISFAGMVLQDFLNIRFSFINSYVYNRTKKSRYLFPFLPFFPKLCTFLYVDKHDDKNSDPVCLSHLSPPSPPTRKNRGKQEEPFFQR